MDDIVLRKVGEPEFNSLPRGVKLLTIGDQYIFVRLHRTSGHLMPLSPQEQEELRKKHLSYG